MGNSKYGRRNLCLGILVVGQILCLAQADDNKPNGWDSVLDGTASDLNSKKGAKKPSSVLRKPSSVLRGNDRELRHKVSVSDRGHLGITGAFVSS